MSIVGITAGGPVVSLAFDVNKLPMGLRGLYVSVGGGGAFTGFVPTFTAEEQVIYDGLCQEYATEHKLTEPADLITLAFRGKTDDEWLAFLRWMRERARFVTPTKTSDSKTASIVANTASAPPQPPASVTAEAQTDSERIYAILRRAAFVGSQLMVVVTAAAKAAGKSHLNDQVRTAAPTPAHSGKQISAQIGKQIFDAFK
jgi:hypothetical protein